MAHREVPSTPADQAVGFTDGIAALGVSPAALREVLHGTTVATNALLERRGARGQDVTPPQLSKGEGYELAPGDGIAGQTPGGGYGPPEHRPAAMRDRDRRRGY